MKKRKKVAGEWTTWNNLYASSMPQGLGEHSSPHLYLHLIYASQLKPVVLLISTSLVSWLTF